MDWIDLEDPLWIVRLENHEGLGLEIDEERER